METKRKSERLRAREGLKAIAGTKTEGAKWKVSACTRSGASGRGLRAAGEHRSPGFCSVIPRAENPVTPC